MIDDYNDPEYNAVEDDTTLFKNPTAETRGRRPLSQPNLSASAGQMKKAEMDTAAIACSYKSMSKRHFSC